MNTDTEFHLMALCRLARAALIWPAARPRARAFRITRQLDGRLLDADDNPLCQDHNGGDSEGLRGGLQTRTGNKIVRHIGFRNMYISMLTWTAGGKLC